jgi:hypothetical protein
MRSLHITAARTVLIGLATAGPACSEPCLYGRTVNVRADETPFPDGSTVFSKCATCPLDKTGPATACSVGFSDGGAAAGVLCLYGPGGTIVTGASQGAVKGVPNHFAYCKARCPNDDDVHVCSVRADASGVTEVRCQYGQPCD